RSTHLGCEGKIPLILPVLIVDYNYKFSVTKILNYLLYFRKCFQYPSPSSFVNKVSSFNPVFFFTRLLMYLASTSISIFTESPVLLCAIVVLLIVSGIREMVISSGPVAAIVKLMPSIATDPFKAINGISSGGTLILRWILPFKSR